MSRLFLFKYPIKKSAFIIVNLFLLTFTTAHILDTLPLYINKLK